jgi:predicted nucleic acid-binding protein
MIIGLDTSFLVQLDVVGHPGHQRARTLRDHRLDIGDRFALAPQVLAEFVQVVTGARRFERPLSVEAALARADAWWNADEVSPIYPNEHTTSRFLTWLREHRLGRKRLLDTLLAATYLTNEVKAIVTANARDYGVFDSFEVLTT